MWDAFINVFVNVLLFIYNVVGQNFGIAIILFTILIRLLTHPLMVQQIKGTQGMQNLQKDPRYLEMQKKYKDDKEKLAQEQMKLYKELGINPFASCLPTLIQFPIIIALYQSITRAMASAPLDVVTLTQNIYPGLLNVAKLIPLNNHFLWMDLGQPERLPIFGIAIPTLAIVVVVTTYVQSKLITPPAADPNDQSAQMGKMMNLYMPFFMGYLAWTLASGLSLYFVASNLIGIAQYAMLGKVNWRGLLPNFSGLKPATSTKVISSKSSTNKANGTEKSDNGIRKIEKRSSSNGRSLERSKSGTRASKK